MAQRPQTRSRITLRVKAVVLVMALVLGCVGAVSGLSVSRTNRVIEAGQRRTAAGIATGIAAASELPLAVGDKSELQRLADQFLDRDTSLAFVALFGEEGGLLASASRDPEAWEHFLTRADARPQYVLEWSDVRMVSDATGADLFGTGDPGAADAREDGGRVAVGLSIRPMLEYQASQARAALWVFCTISVVSAPLALLLVGGWTRRLWALVKASERISRGEVGVAHVDLHSDEIGTLARAFEHMRQAIAERDETERRRQEELRTARDEAERANGAKSQFLAHMSHEIRTPLNGVVGMLDLLRMTQLDARQGRFVDLARSSADTLLSLINNVLDFSKIEADKLELECTEFDMGDLVASVGEMLAPKAEQKRIELILSVGANVPRHFRGDPDRLRQVLVNLVNNAIKFTERGEVVVRVSLIESGERTETLRVQVSDTGIGIPPERRERLFKSFSQVDASTTRRFGGTGLGLAISKKLVERMGGQIGIDPQRTIGSEFWFTVRLGRSERAETAEDVRAHRLDGLSVLIVDDTPTNCEILVELLGAWGMRPKVAGCGREALEELRRAAASGDPYPLGIIDMQMPDMDGAQLADAISTEYGDRRPCLIMLTSLNMPFEQSDLENLGIARCLPKPTRFSTLYEVVAECVGAPPVEPARRVETRETPRAHAKCRGLRVLVAEDNPVNQVVVRELLAQFGAIPTIVENGALAVEAVKAGAPDAVLMDCEMPRMDGFEATRRIREWEETTGAPRLPIIALTANAVQGDRERCLSAGMDDYLAKPIEPRLLVRALSGASGGKGEERAGVGEGARGAQLAPAQVLAAKAPGPPAGAAPVDVEDALRRCCGNSEILLQVFDEFARSAERAICDLDRGIREGSREEVARVAHSLRGAAANISAREAAGRAGSLESVAKGSEGTGLGEQFEALRDELQRVLEELPRAREVLRGRDAR
ncbi:MAG: response regulator [Phycisphaerales bacterium]|nr:response regulator [Phycisphaerales bacterium]